MKYVKPFLIGLAVYFLGYLITALISEFFAGGDIQRSYFCGIIYSILYLSAVVATVGATIIEEIRNSKAN